ncbi:MAG: ATP-binding protein [Methanomassiliicoccales archaeon]|nr:ATP-binding protein [Methanomassiliicoccales archaeon]
MLIEFRVSNFRSIKEKLNFSMVASNDRAHDKHLMKVEGMSDDKLLVTSVLYGANAAGKTNLILALNVMRNMVIGSHMNQRGVDLPYDHFKFDKRCEGEPTSFEIVFLVDSVKFVYGYSYDKTRVADEYLYMYPKRKKAVIFERRSGEPMKFPRAEKEINDQRETIERTTGENVLFLSMAAKMNYKPVFPVFDWIQKGLMTVGPADGPVFYGITLEMMKNDPESRNMILKALSIADLGITDIREDEDRPDDRRPDFPPPPRPGEGHIVVQFSFGGPRISFIHKPYGNLPNAEPVRLPISSESEGTKKLFGLIGPWIEALRTGGTLVVDELDTKLHHLIVQFLVGLFHDPKQNSKGAQLIFTTHNVKLLDLDLFRRDELWFFERDEEGGATKAFSLAEFKVRKDLNIENAYLAGRFGAIPFILEDRVL